MIHIKCEKVSPLCLLVGDPGRASLIASSFLKDAKCTSEHRGLLCFDGIYKEKNISVLTTGMGSASCAIVLEEAIALGAHVVIRVGTCGAVQPYIKVGSLIIPNGAVPLCGILQSYGIERLPPIPDYKVLSSLIQVANEEKIEFHIGLVCTSDAFYKEKEDALSWSKKNILAFEMECAAVFALSYIKGVKAGAILAVTGNIIEGTQVLDNPLTRKAIEDEIKVALEAIIACESF